MTKRLLTWCYASPVPGVLAKVSTRPGTHVDADVLHRAVDNFATESPKPTLNLYAE